MERDFMGLNAKDSPVVVVAIKEEVVEDTKDTGFGRSSGIPSPFFSKNIVGAHVKQQLLGGNLLTTTPVVGTTEQWINSKASEVPAQFTIFYNGTVNIFDDITPEKAEAIILLAGKGCILSNTVQEKIDVQAPVSVSETGEPYHNLLNRAVANQSMSMPKCSGMPSRISVSSHVPAANNEDIKPNAIAMSATLGKRGEPPVVVMSPGPVSATAMMSSAVPQERKASLARFLEKRKERVMKAAPYNLSKKADSATPESTDFGFSATSGVGSCSVTSSKEINGEV